MGFAALLNIADSKVPWTQQSKVLALVIKPLLDASTMNDMLFLRLHRGVPPIYKSGCRYQEEPPTYVTFADGTQSVVEEFASLPVVIARGWGDCDDLAPWRCAELRNRGEKASLRIQWRKQPSGRKLYHILVRRIPGPGWVRRPIGLVPQDFDPRFMVLTKNGSVIEDPSRALGMPSSIAGMYRDALLQS